MSVYFDPTLAAAESTFFRASGWGEMEPEAEDQASCYDAERGAWEDRTAGEALLA